MAGIMVRYDDLRRYCEKRHCGSVPIEYIKQMLTIEAVPVRHGQWSEIYCYTEHGVAMADYECTNCGAEISKQRGNTPKYCEHCGADMREEGADND